MILRYTVVISCYYLAQNIGGIKLGYIVIHIKVAYLLDVILEYFSKTPFYPYKGCCRIKVHHKAVNALLSKEWLHVIIYPWEGYFRPGGKTTDCLRGNSPHLC